MHPPAASCRQRSSVALLHLVRMQIFTWRLALCATSLSSLHALMTRWMSAVNTISSCFEAASVIMSSISTRGSANSIVREVRSSAAQSQRVTLTHTHTQNKRVTVSGLAVKCLISPVASVTKGDPVISLPFAQCGRWHSQRAQRSVMGDRLASLDIRHLRCIALYMYTTPCRLSQ